jgi:hypothetical protein
MMDLKGGLFVRYQFAGVIGWWNNIIIIAKREHGWDQELWKVNDCSIVMDSSLYRIL